MKKRKKGKWRLILAGLLSLFVLAPLILWFGLTWFIRATVKSPVQKKSPRAMSESISKEERQQLDEVIKKRRP